jgi:hypothetical protein
MKSPLCGTGVLLFALPLLLGGCARVNDMTANLLASDVPAHAVIGERLLAGRALLYADRTGSLTLQGRGEPALSCMATLRYTASTSGTLDLRCSDGLQARMPFTALGETSGHARTAPQAISLAYGLDPEAARAWLTPPPGKRLVVSGGSVKLEQE